ncbi:MAG: hypothetical protein ACRDLK_07795, partial [Gaiellaceae bacterium]
ATSKPSAPSSTLSPERRSQELDEQAFEQIDVAMLYIEQARERTERATAEMKKLGADAHLIEAMERAQEELSDLARRLRQGTFFAVPKEQLSL